MVTERPCIDCGEPTLNEERCRDCDIEHSLARMECPHCKRMRYRTDDELARRLGEYFWGPACKCGGKA